MKIAMVCSRYDPYIGGVETHVKQISENLVKNGYSIDVLTTDPSGKENIVQVINGVRIKRFKSVAPSEAYYFSWKLQQYLTNHSKEYDIVHAHSYHGFPALHAAQSKSSNGFIFTPHFHGTGHTLLRKLLHIPYKHVGKSIFKKSDKIICVSNFEKRTILDAFNLDENKIRIIPNGINQCEYGYEKRNKKHRVILCVSRLEKYKGIDHIIRALPKLNDDIHLEIVGRGPYRKNLDYLIQRLKVQNRVYFSEELSRNDLIQKYVDADVFILLSTNEAFGICVAEALASGTVCIVANTSGLSEWVDGVNCFGIGYPINTSNLVSLINNVIGGHVRGIALPSWNESVLKHIQAYLEIITE